jgi:hypothetical protein
MSNKRQSTTFASYRIWYASHADADKKNASRERSALGKLGDFFNPHGLDAIDRPLVRKWRAWRGKKVSAATVRREEKLLERMLNAAVGKYLASNPLAGTKARAAAPAHERKTRKASR